jgi:hypothetical protein
MVPEENAMMEKSHFLPTKEITLWKLCHQNELMDDFNKLHCPANKCINYHE